MNTDDLRDALGNEALRQPPVSPDFRSGVDRRVRRQRARAALAVGPAVVLLVLAAVVLVPRASNDTTLSTADGSTGTSAAPAPTEAPNTTENAGTPSTSIGGGAPAASVDCGTVTIEMVPSAEVPTDPFTCFFKAVNNDGAAALTIVTTSAEGGSITEHLTSAPGHVVTVAGSGSITAKLPALNFGGGADNPFPGSAAPSSGDCGTITFPVPDLSTISPDRQGMPGSSGMPGKGGWSTSPDMKAMSCLVGALTSGGEAHLTINVQDTEGGTMTVSVAIGADHTLTLSLDGSLTVQLPADLKVPEDMLNAIPPGTLGMGQLVPGMGPRKHQQ
jgi:hypothetical protein